MTSSVTCSSTPFVNVRAFHLLLLYFFICYSSSTLFVNCSSTSYSTCSNSTCYLFKLHLLPVLNLLPVLVFNLLTGLVLNLLPVLVFNLLPGLVLHLLPVVGQVVGAREGSQRVHLPLQQVPQNLPHQGRPKASPSPS